MRLTSLLKTAATLALLVPAAAACGDDATGPDGTGTATAVVHDDPSSGSAAMQPSFSKIRAAATSEGSYSGELRANVTVQVSADGDAWTDVYSQATGSSEVDLQTSSETTLVTDASVDAGTYSYVRVVLQSPSAHLNSGSTISGSTGDLTLDADVSLALGSDGQVVVEKEVADFEISADSNTRISTDLNSEAWIDQESVEAQAVSSSEVQSATVVTIS